MSLWRREMDLREFSTLCKQYLSVLSVMNDVLTVPSMSKEYQKEALDLVGKIVACGNKILAEIEAERLLVTPGGETVKAKDLEKLERIECPVCHRAVLEDEFLQCAVCEADVCLYCYENETHIHGDDQ